MLLDHIEQSGVPLDIATESALDEFNAEEVSASWSKALDRRLSDPEGAITLSRTLLESTCKHILDELGVEYRKSDDLPTLYKMTAKSLNLAPSQHTEKVFKQILGGCVSIVEGLGSLRNSLGDAHGGGQAKVRPAVRHAELAVNLVGTTATFLISTHKFRQQESDISS